MVVVFACGCFIDIASEGSDDGRGGTDATTQTDESGTSSGSDSSTGAQTSSEGSSTGPCADGFEDILVNGGFENWDNPQADPIPWHVVFGGSSHSHETESGMNAMQLVGKFAQPDGGWSILQEIGGGFDTGEEFDFFARVRLLSGTGGELHVSFDAADFPQTTLPFVGSGQWEDLEASLVLGGPTPTLPLYLTSYNPDQTVLVDDVRLLRGCQ